MAKNGERSTDHGGRIIQPRLRGSFWQQPLCQLAIACCKPVTTPDFMLWMDFYTVQKVNKNNNAVPMHSKNMKRHWMYVCAWTLFPPRLFIIRIFLKPVRWLVLQTRCFLQSQNASVRCHHWSRKIPWRNCKKLEATFQKFPTCPEKCLMRRLFLHFWRHYHSFRMPRSLLALLFWCSFLEYTVKKG